MIVIKRLSQLVVALALIPLTALALPGDREQPHHVILTPARALTDADRAALAQEGIELQRAVGGGRFVARVDDEAVAATDERIASIHALSMRDKLHPTAIREGATGRAFSRVRIFFNDDVSMDAARASVLAAGGSLDDPQATRLEPLQSIAARVPSAALTTLAADDRVLVVYGARTFHPKSLNASAALLSHVSDVQAAPYNLTGNGIVLTYFELGTAYAAHPEFGGRLNIANFPCTTTDTECNDSSNKDHATHTAGTMIAAGIMPSAKGMAPSATLYEFRANFGTWLDQKDSGLKNLGSVADNNSWGYILGWTNDGSGWVWNEGDELIGGYTGDINAVFDHIASTNGTLGIWSAGNDAGVGGPNVAPYSHKHVDDQGNATSSIYCYSANGSGTDCPTNICAAGTQFCETVRHPTHDATANNPGGSIGWTASSKNILAVGATDANKIIASFSSRGPTKDGRVKPDITAKGKSLYSTISGGLYASMQGTSMAAPVVTGTMALLVEQWKKTNASAVPLPVTLKALAIAGADDVGNAGPDYTYGYGFLNGKASVDLIIADGGIGKRVKIGSATQGSSTDYPLTATAGQPLRAVLTWFDPEVLPLGSEETADKTLVNDLDVRLVDPSGATILPYVLDPTNPGATATRGVNTIDNTEEIEVASTVAGTYHLLVNGTTVPKGPQQYVLISTSDLSAVAAPCSDPTEPNDTPATGYALAISEPIVAFVCSSSDLDYFLVTPAAAGAVSVAVTATDTPVKVTLLLNDTTVATANAGAGATATVSTTAASGTSHYVVKVEPQGAPGATGAYTITAVYPLSSPARRHVTRH